MTAKRALLALLLILPAAGCGATGSAGGGLGKTGETPCVKPCSGCRLAVKRCALCPAGGLR